jgi:hypothetical protein
VIRAAAALAVGMLSAAPLAAQDVEPVADESRAVVVPAPDDRRLEDAAKFLVGAAIGLGAHEAGHVISGAIFGADPGVKPITYGPLPFFAITHEPVSPAREYIIAASGFFMQHATSEWVLTRRPGLAGEHAPYAKGLLAFNVMTSAVYATAAFGRFGPAERDTLAMAEALDVGEPLVGAMILAPAVVDTWRYFKPGSKWAPWVSRALKVGAVVAVVRAAR